MGMKWFRGWRATGGEGWIELVYYDQRAAQPEPKPELTVRIYRKIEQKFSFSFDGMEYFDGLTTEGAELIYVGTTEQVGVKKFRYIDDEVEYGQLYMYWMTDESDESLVGPICVRLRDPHIWWPVERIDSEMRRLTERFPSRVRMEQYGETAQGRELYGLQVGSTDRCVALIGLIHAGESGPELWLPAAERLLEEQSDLLDQVGLAILPVVNKDERSRQVEGYPPYLRTNARGVDLNRNFPASWEVVSHMYQLSSAEPDSVTYRGRYAASEPETRAVMAFADQVRPQLVLSSHALSSLCSPHFLTTTSARRDERILSDCRVWLSEYREGFYERASEQDYTPVYACTEGSLTTWLYEALGIIGFDVEFSGADEIEIIREERTTRELLARYQQRHYEGLKAMLEQIR